MRKIVATLVDERQRLRARDAALLLCALLGCSAQAAVEGRVQDKLGAPVAGAQVALVTASQARETTTTSADGAFAFDLGAASTARIDVHADGFEPAVVRWTPSNAALVVTLERIRFREQVSVTANRTETRQADEPARVIVLQREDLRAAGALTLDDALRIVPGFSLFRRSGSTVANPTAQGVSLRGVGPSGASRALVLLDGVPLNDAFGGWVYWSRVPQAALQRVELVEGGASHLYGTSALGGVIQAVTRNDAPAVTLETVAGAHGTAATSLYAAAQHGSWTVRASGDALTTDGYVIVDDVNRGAVDTAAGSRHLGGALTLARRFDGGTEAQARGSVFLSASALGESRRNGTPLQVNDSDWQQLSGGGDWQTASGAFSLRGWHGTQTYHQSFSAVAAGRASESLTRLQVVPSSTSGLTLQWSRLVGARHAVLVGTDGGWVDGRSDETPVVAGRVGDRVSAGGSQRTLAAFALDRVSLGARVWVVGGVRADMWRLEPSAPQAGAGAGDAHAFSPRISVLVRAVHGWDVTAAAYGAFRAPTLNELYRSFRVGDTVTQANPELTQERLRGAEAGVRWGAPQGRARLRLVAFLAQVEDPVANLTLATTPALTTRRRQNLGRTRSRGVELDGELRLARGLNATLGYALIDATVRDFPADPLLEHKLLPQVARHQFTLQARYTDIKRLDLSAQVRTSSRQYEDDRNLLPLAAYVTLDARAAGRLRSGVEAFVAVENLTGRRYDTGATPLPTLGPPRLARAGLRVEWNGRK